MSENQVQREVLPGPIGPFTVARREAAWAVVDSRGHDVCFAEKETIAQALCTLLNSHQSQALVSLLAACKALAAHATADADGNHVCWVGESTISLAVSAISLAEKGAA